MFLQPETWKKQQQQQQKKKQTNQQLIWDILKGTLMQIWKFHYMFGFTWKHISWKFRILNPKNFRVIYPWSLYFP